MDESHPPAVAELEQKEPPMTELEGEPPMTEVSLIASSSQQIGYKGGLQSVISLIQTVCDLTIQLAITICQLETMGS